MKTHKQDHALMELLKIKEISRIICDTDMGTLKLRIRKGEKEYRFVLDSVELDKNTNKEVFELLYPPITKDIRDYPLQYGTKTEIQGDSKIVPGSVKIVSIKNIKSKAKNGRKTK